MEFYLNPDRERTNLTLVMALLVNGRTVLEDFSWSAEGRSFANALEEFGLTLNLQGHEMVLTGKGFQYPVPGKHPESDIGICGDGDGDRHERLGIGTAANDTDAVQDMEQDTEEHRDGVYQGPVG